MNTEQTAQQVRESIDIFNQLTQSGAATALIFAAILGLGVALAVRVPAHELIERDRIANWVVWMSFIVGGFIACWLLWPDDPWTVKQRLAFSLSIGFGTPAIWWLVGKIVSWMRPEWGKAISLNKITFDEEPPKEPSP